MIWRKRFVRSWLALVALACGCDSTSDRPVQNTRTDGGPRTTPTAVKTAGPESRTPQDDLKPAGLTVLLGATVFDGTGRDPVANGAVVLERNRIKAVGSAAEISVPDGARRIDVKGKWIVPGLIDTHIHFFQSAGLYTRPDIVDLRKIRPYQNEVAAIKKSLVGTFRRYLASGVTAVVDVGGPFWNFDVRQQARSKVMAPRVAVAGPLISTVARPQLDIGDPPIIKASSPAEARTLVRKQLARQPDLIKIWFIVTPQTDVEEAVGILRAVISEAHNGSVRVAVHATEIDSATKAVEAGADILVHSVHDGPIDRAFTELLKKRQVIYIPTLAVMEGYAEVLGQQLELSDFEKRYGDPAAIASWAELGFVEAATPVAALAARIKKLRARAPIMQANLRAVQHAGIIIAAGTDAGNIGTLHGPSFHRELQLMAQAGLSARAIVLSATRDAAKVFAKNAEIGTLEAGKLADLLVLDADPLADIANLKRIFRVVKGGVVLEPAQILPPNPAVVVQAQVEAYNARDLEAFLANYAPDVVIKRHPSGKVIARGRAGMRPIYAKLFKSSPELHSTILKRVVEGNMVVDHELVTGISDRPYVHAVANYRVTDGLIDRVWFLPR